MVCVLLILRGTSYFDGLRTIDTLRYFVFRWVAFLPTPEIHGGGGNEEGGTSVY